MLTSHARIYSLSIFPGLWKMGIPFSAFHLVFCNFILLKHILRTSHLIYASVCSHMVHKNAICYNTIFPDEIPMWGIILADFSAGKMIASLQECWCFLLSDKESSVACHISLLPWMPGNLEPTWMLDYSCIHSHSWFLWLYFISLDLIFYIGVLMCFPYNPI